MSSRDEVNLDSQTESPEDSLDVTSDEQVFGRYSARLAQLAQKHLSVKLTSRIDGEDVAQSAFRTFFRRRGAGQFTIDSSSDLWRLLAHIAIRKAQAYGRRHSAKKRDASAEVDDENHNATSNEPMPEAAVIVEDEIERVLTGLPEQYSETPNSYRKAN